ncbi:cysteine desulfurase family protein [Pedobacter aquatilis]|uniref:cysteine desulfurase family protein n=1 Tax=Pedobacter aquatilis TaxID=351343 RepID=UPI00292DB21A|nr:cysteine desulfurase family protein [Pedobacter aquatilis]
MNIYLDNAATTPLANEVFAAMQPFIFESFANPSSAHSLGRNAREAVEKSRKIIAENLHTEPGNIFFTSGGTEGDNTAILSAIYGNNIRLAITSRLEHHAVLNTLQALEQSGAIRLIYLENDSKGKLSLNELVALLENEEPAFISLMHGNNEIGNLNPILEIADLADHHGAIFHSDTVQTIGHISFNTHQLAPDFLVGSAHKFHGPKGVGFLYAKAPANLRSFINGGSQEWGKRAGTENVAGIVGMATALQNAYENQNLYETHINLLKTKLINGLGNLPGISFNGFSGSQDKSLSTVLSISLPELNDGGNLLQVLDKSGIFASGGSACSSNHSSHVIKALRNGSNNETVRFSFSRFNTESEIDEVIACLNKLYPKNSLPQNLLYA